MDKVIQKENTNIRFNFYSLYFTPYAGEENDCNSVSILVDVVSFLFKEKEKGRVYLIDKNSNNKNADRRELFVTSTVYMHKEKRIRCSIALLRNGRVPKIKPKNSCNLVPLKDIGDIAEETHFYIDYNRATPILCVEYNHYGPRISDIEFYLRDIARNQLHLSKATRVELFMKNSIDSTIKNLKNVLKFEIKIQPKNVAQIDKDIVGKYFTGLNSIGNSLKPNFLKLEVLFQAPGQSVKSNEINTDANNMATYMLNKFKTKPDNIDCFDNFVIRYEDKEGNEEVFNLLRDKETIEKLVDLSTIKKKRNLYELIESDFNEFMRKTNARSIF